MIGRIESIENGTMNIKVELCTMYVAKEHHHPEFFKPGTVNINITDGIFGMIEGNTPEGKGYWIKCV